MISLLISITLKGKVLDEETSQPMGYTAIILYKDTTIVAGTYADDKGGFILKELKPGEYILNAHFIGDEKKRIKKTLILTTHDLSIREYLDHFDNVVEIKKEVEI
ncbi:MAG: carboxypeptidase-like regulatory domain-containing protein [Candidatus Caldipriscus sp.]